MKGLRIALIMLIPLFAVVFFMKGYIIQNPTPEDCEIKEILVSKVYEGGVKDIAFSHADGSVYYINRGLEQGMTLKSMEEKLLNKKVTLHLAKTVAGTSRHIAQLAIDETVIYTEFD